MLFSLLVVAMLTPGWANGQNLITVTGHVTDPSSEPVIGATVIVVGTSNGVATDLDGNYTLPNVPTDATLHFSFVGMVGQDIRVDGRTIINVQLVDDAQHLEEVVVIGYGSAKAKDLTAPISVVKGSEIVQVPSGTPMTALTGKVPGVNVINAGTPGDGPTVQIRGIGSFSANTPLFVVDGVFYDNINFLNNDDIQEMSILKDASAAAIYGVKAANGVVLITTKKGVKNQAAKVTYNGYVGFQTATDKLKMCDSHEYATMLMEADPDAYSSSLQKSIDAFGGNMGSLTFNANTDWYDEMLRNAVITNHALNIAGGSEKATYAIGMNYFYQDGVMKSENHYKKLNFRAQIDYDVNNWLKVGFNGIFGQSTQQLPNNEAWQSAFNMPGIIPVMDPSNDATFPEKYASPNTVGFTNNFYNPVAASKYYENRNQNYQALTNFFADVTFIPSKLNYRMSYGYDYQSKRGRHMEKPYFVSTNQKMDDSKLTKTNTENTKWVWDNILTYKDSFGRHGVGAMVGYSMRQDRMDKLEGYVNGVPVDSKNYWYLHQGNQTTSRSDDDGTRYRSQSVFTRLNYDFDGKYLLMFTFRADGSSKYQTQWGYFPSVGASWVLSNENFMKNQHWADYLKLRASWGKLGNDNVAASDGFASITTGNNASGVFDNNVINGYQNTTYFSWLKWEVVNETNVGLEYAVFNHRLSMDLDWFKRITTRAVISPLVPFTNSVLAGNYGKIENMGIDLSLNWKDHIGKVDYYVNGTISTVRNRVKNLEGLPHVLGGKTINMVGKRMNSYYGYKVVGVYQTPEQCAQDPVAVANNLQPGDFIYEDVNKDGVIDGQDRQTLGSYLPSFTYGLNLGFQYKGLDFAVSTYGQAGGKLYNRKRALRYAQGNYNFDHDQFKHRWTGAGSTNKYPSAGALMRSWNVSASATSTNSYFVEKADFFRIQNITLGYTLRNLKMSTYTLPSVRFYVNADRPFNFFSANTFSPEVTDPEGWDTQVYPLTATCTFGMQIEF